MPTREERENLSFDKAKLENEKLSLEVSKLKKQPEIKIQFLTLVMTTVIALISLFSLKFIINLYDTKSETLGLRKEKLDKDVSTFQGKRDSLLASVNYLQDSLNRINFKNHQDF